MKSENEPITADGATQKVFLDEGMVLGLIHAHLETLGLYCTSSALEREVGCSVAKKVPPEARGLRDAILRGRWSETSTCLKNLIEDETKAKEALSQITKQKYTELVVAYQEADDDLADDLRTAASVCFSELTTLGVERKDELRRLKNLTYTLEAYVGAWDLQSSRIECFEKVWEIATGDSPRTFKNTRGKEMDRLLQLLVKGLLHESCEEFCRRKASMEPAFELELPSLVESQPDACSDTLMMKLDSEEVQLPYSFDSDFISWLKTVPWILFQKEFVHSPVSVQVNEFRRPDKERRWTEEILSTIESEVPNVEKRVRSQVLSRHFAGETSDILRRAENVLYRWENMHRRQKNDEQSERIENYRKSYPSAPTHVKKSQFRIETSSDSKQDFGDIWNQAETAFASCNRNTAGDTNTYEEPKKSICIQNRPQTGSGDCAALSKDINASDCEVDNSKETNVTSDKHLANYTTVIANADSSDFPIPANDKGLISQAKTLIQKHITTDETQRPHPGKEAKLKSRCEIPRKFKNERSDSILLSYLPKFPLKKLRNRRPEATETTKMLTSAQVGAGDSIYAGDTPKELTAKNDYREGVDITERGDGNGRKIKSNPKGATKMEECDFFRKDMSSNLVTEVPRCGKNSSKHSSKDFVKGTPKTDYDLDKRKEYIFDLLKLNVQPGREQKSTDQIDDSHSCTSSEGRGCENPMEYDLQKRKSFIHDFLKAKENVRKELLKVGEKP